MSDKINWIIYANCNSLIQKWYKVHTWNFCQMHKIIIIIRAVLGQYDGQNILLPGSK